jgi:hypothetical protein
VIAAGTAGAGFVGVCGKAACGIRIADRQRREVVFTNVEPQNRNVGPGTVFESIARLKLSVKD